MRRSTRWLTRAIVVVAVAWAPLVILVRGARDQLGPQLGFAITVFVWLAFPAILIWGIVRTFLYVLELCQIIATARVVPGTCHTCGYNLRGNVSGICPECGTP